MKRAISVVLAVLLLAPSVRAELRLVTQIEDEVTAGKKIFVDARAESMCMDLPLTDSVCLPVERLIGSRGRLANMRDIRWFLGTLGITGNETAIVVADDSRRRDIVAAVLYLAGQREVIRAVTSVSGLLRQGQLQRGRTRGAALFRVAVFEQPVRDRFLVPTTFHSLHPEVATFLARFSEKISTGTLDPFRWPIEVVRP